MNRVLVLVTLAGLWLLAMPCVNGQTCSRGHLLPRHPNHGLGQTWSYGACHTCAANAELESRREAERREEAEASRAAERRAERRRAVRQEAEERERSEAIQAEMVAREQARVARIEGERVAREAARSRLDSWMPTPSGPREPNILENELGSMGDAMTLAGVRPAATVLDFLGAASSVEAAPQKDVAVLGEAAKLGAGVGVEMGCAALAAPWVAGTPVLALAIDRICVVAGSALVDAGVDQAKKALSADDSVIEEIQAFTETCRTDGSLGSKKIPEFTDAESTAISQGLSDLGLIAPNPLVSPLPPTPRPTTPGGPSIGPAPKPAPPRGK